jgi:carbonic anhydrase/acetyltransferase-like protein (isoleucine patch superfamily)
VQRDLLYREREVTVARSARIGAECVLGSGSVIGAHVQLERSVIGRNCVIGDGAILIDALLWDNVVIEENARVEGSLLASRVHVSSRSVVPRGCVLGEEVRVGSNANLQPHSSFAGERHTVGNNEAPELGQGGSGRSWQVADVRLLRGTTLWPREEELSAAEIADTSSSSSSDSESDDHADDGGSVYVSGRLRFFREVAETVMRAFEAARLDPSGAVNLDSVRLEVGSLKLVYDFSFSETAEAILSALIGLSTENIGSRAKLAVMLRRWLPLFDVYLASPSRASDEVELLYKLPELLSDDAAWRSRAAWPELILALLDAGIVQRAQVRTWATELRDDDEEEDDSRAVARNVLRALDEVGIPNKSGTMSRGSRDAGGEALSDDDDENAEADLFDDTTDGWFSGASKSDVAANAWWEDEDGDADHKKGDTLTADEATPRNDSENFWTADDTFDASDDEDD